MKKLLLGTLLSVFFYQQSLSQKIQLGISMGYDMGINFEETSTHKSAEFSKSTESMNVDLFAKIPIKDWFNVYPIAIFTVLKGEFTLDNMNGDFLPEGATVSLPYQTYGNGWSVDYYGDDYESSYSEGYVSQNSLGGFVTKEIVEGLEIGTGLLYKFKKMSIDNFLAYDEYIWDSSTDTLYDNYDYVDTHEYVFETKTMKRIQISVPIIVQYNMDIDSIFMGFSFLTYIGEDTYFSMRMTMGVNLKAKYTRK